MMRIHHVQVGMPDVDGSQRHNADGFQRFHVRDPFGNRVEIVWPTGD